MNIYPSNAYLWQCVRNTAEALALADRSNREIVAMEYADIELIIMSRESDLKERNGGK